MDKAMTSHEWLTKELLTVPNFLTTLRILGTFYLITHLVAFGLTPMTLFGITSAWVLPLLASAIVLTDTLDGFIARHFHCTSKLGSALDAFADKVFNWGIAFTLLFTGVLPVTSLLLLAPTIVRDIYVASVTAIDKLEDGKFKIQKRTIQGEKTEDKTPPFFLGDGMLPTIYGKAKMWPMSIAIISGLRYGYQLSGNYLFPVFSVLADACSIVDLFAVSKNARLRRENRKEELVQLTTFKEGTSSKKKINEKSRLLTPKVALQSVRTFDLPKQRKVPTEEQCAIIDQQLSLLEQADTSMERGKAPYQKK